MKPPCAIIDDFVLDNLEHAPLSKQIEVSEAMLALSSTPAEKARWVEHLTNLRQIQYNAKQLWFGFRSKRS